MPQSSPKNNSKSLKHGLYARRFRRQEVEDLDALRESGLVNLLSEISILRIAISRAFNQASEAEATGAEVDWIAYLSSIGLAANRLANILRTEQSLEGDQQEEVKATLIKAFTQIAKEKNLSV